MSPEIMEIVLHFVLKGTKNVWPNHFVTQYQTLRNVCPLWEIICDGRRFIRRNLPQIHIGNRDILPAANSNGTITVQVKSIFDKIGLSGLTDRLRNIINDKRWKTAWLNIVLLEYSWYAIKNIYWNKRKK